MLHGHCVTLFFPFLKVIHDRSLRKNQLLREHAEFESRATLAEARVRKLEAVDLERLHVIHGLEVEKSTLKKKVQGTACIPESVSVLLDRRRNFVHFAAEQEYVNKLKAELKAAEAANAKQEELRIAAEAGESALSRKLAHHKAIHRDLEKDLVQAMQTLRSNVTTIAELKSELHALQEAATEVVEQITPEDPAHPKTILERLKDTPLRVKALLKETAKACASGILTTCRILYPSAGLEPVAEGLPEDISDDQLQLAQAAVEPLAEKIAENMNL